MEINRLTLMGLMMSASLLDNFSSFGATIFGRADVTGYIWVGSDLLALLLNRAILASNLLLLTLLILTGVRIYNSILENRRRVTSSKIAEVYGIGDLK